MKINPYLTILTCCLYSGATKAQSLKKIFIPTPEKGSHIYKDRDTTYIYEYPRCFIGRVYLQNVMNSSVIVGNDGLPNLKYVPNKGTVLGFGGGYRFISLNIGREVFKRDDARGVTSSFEFQSNLYYRKWAFDVMYRNIKGLYLNDKDHVLSEQYYADPTMRLVWGGMNAWRILNYQKFSYKSVMTQSELQLKSAGSFILGGEAYFGGMSTQNEFVPSSLQSADVYLQGARGSKSLKFFKIGPGVGYAYNLAIAKHWFANASFTINTDLIFSQELGKSTTTADVEKANRIGFQPNCSYRASVGYNSDNYNINFQFLGNNSSMTGALSQGKYHQFAGTAKITYNYRFKLGHKTRKALLPVDDKLDYLDDKTKEIIQGKPAKG